MIDSRQTARDPPVSCPFVKIVASKLLSVFTDVPLCRSVLPAKSMSSFGSVSLQNITRLSHGSSAGHRVQWRCDHLARRRVVGLKLRSKPRSFFLVSEMEMLRESRARDKLDGVDRNASIVDRNQFFNTQVNIEKKDSEGYCASLFHSAVFKTSQVL